MNKSKTLSRLMIISYCLALTGMMLGNIAMAQDAEKIKQLEEKFKAADKNADGKLTPEEAKEGMPRVARAFDKIDTQKNGYITLDQIKAAMN